MNFSEILTTLQTENFAIARRSGWNGKGMAVALMPGKTILAHEITPRTAALLDLIEGGRDDTAELVIGAYFVLYTATATWQPGWVPSQADLSANDWEVVVGEAMGAQQRV
jgi:hypothetical protein